MSNQLKKKFLGSDSVDGSKIKFSNDDAFRARNALNTADISLFKLNTLNEFELLVLPKYNNSNVATEGYVDSQVSAVANDVANLVTLSGVAVDSTSLGEFDGLTIQNNRKVKEALQDLETAHELHLNASVDAHDASAISYVNTASQIGSTTVQAAIDNIEGRVDALEVGGGDTKQVKISADDSTEGYLEDKVVGTSGKIVVSTINGAANEDLKIDIGADVFDKVVDDTDDIVEGATKLFFTDARARTAAVADSIVDGVLNIAPSQNAVHDALALKVAKSGDTMTGFLTLHADPSSDLHAATKRYVDAIAEGLHVHAPAKAILNSALIGTVTYDNGTSGVGATLTLDTALISIDGYTLQDQDRIIINGQANQAHNGIYVYQTGGTELIRASDFDTTAEAAGGDFIFVQEGILYGNAGFVMTETTSAIGTSPIVFIQFSGAGQLLEGDAIDLNGNEINVLYDNVGIALNGSNQLEIKDAGVTSDKIAADSVTAIKIASDVAGAGLVQDPGTGALKVNVDDDSLEIGVSNDVIIKNSGVTESKIADSAVATAKIADNAVTAAKINSDVAGLGLVQDGASGALEVNVDDASIEILTNAVQIKNLGVTTEKLNALAVTEAKIADSAVTTNKINDNAVTRDKIASNVAGNGLGQDVDGALEVKVDTSTLEISGDILQIKDLGVTTAKLNSLAVTEAKIDNSAVTTSKIADTAVTAAKINSDVAGNGLGQNGTSGALEVKVDGLSIELASDAVQIKDAGVTTAKIATDAVDKSKINSDVAGIGLQQDPDGSLAVKLDGTSLSKSSNGIKLNIEFNKEAYTIVAADTVLASNYYDLGFVVEPKSIVAFVDRVGIHEGATEDYTVSLTGGVGGVTRVTFVNALVTPGQQQLAAGDKLYFTYQKKIS